ncbi:MAG: type II toxin-antitoxin system Phd/YefM family antitoxin [Bacillota bacterium]
MPVIKPSSELRNNYQEISALAKEIRQPIYITVNGKGDTAIMDIDALDNLYARIELQAKLIEGLNELENGKTKTHEAVFAKFRG